MGKPRRRIRCGLLLFVGLMLGADCANVGLPGICANAGSEVRGGDESNPSRGNSSQHVFEGLWTTSYGSMRLWQQGDTVHGVYDYHGIAHIHGQVQSDGLHFSYDQPDGEKGEGIFTLDASGDAFGGKWKVAATSADSNPATGQWTGKRVQPNPDQVWLVILEANWETSLTEPEYNYGEMLRTFFTRVPKVQVRHRFFSDAAEFRRWCDEIRFLPGPVVLYISSHGSKEGVWVNGHTIGADVLTDCLRDSGQLRLVHFGACEVAGGDIPKKIQSALGPEATFPISGFANDADWAGSAIVDFTYLSLVLEEDEDPTDAVRQTRKMVTFARKKGEVGDPISSSDLVIFDAPKPAKDQRSH